MATQPQEPHDTPAPSGALGEISQGPGAFESFLDQHHKKILIFGLLAAAGVAGYVVKEGIDEGRETAGGHALHQASDLASLQDILENHADSRAAGSAAILLAETQWTEGQQDAAIETLREFIASPDFHPAKPTARASLGSKLASQGKTGDATEVFRALADDRAEGTHLAAYALIGLGDLAHADGNIDEAEAHYTRVRSEFATSPFSDAAIRRLQFLRAEMPTPVEPPAVETPEEISGQPVPQPVEIPEAEIASPDEGPEAEKSEDPAETEQPGDGEQP